MRIPEGMASAEWGTTRELADCATCGTGLVRPSSNVLWEHVVASGEPHTAWAKRGTFIASATCRWCAEEVQRTGADHPDGTEGWTHLVSGQRACAWIAVRERQRVQRNRPNQTLPSGPDVRSSWDPDEW